MSDQTSSLRAEAEMVPAGWQRRFGNGRYRFANGTLWSEWSEWINPERYEESGSWKNQFRQVFAYKE